nr:pleckstrin homology domain-containing family H member 1-like [Parasteatoda tepidariorum]
MQPIVRYPYGVVVTFGGCKEDFMLVVCQTTVDQKTSGEGIQVTERLLFSMPKPKDVQGITNRFMTQLYYVFIPRML